MELRNSNESRLKLLCEDILNKKVKRATIKSNLDAIFAVSITSLLFAFSKYSHGNKSDVNINIKANKISINTVIKKIEIAILFKFL